MIINTFYPFLIIIEKYKYLRQYKEVIIVCVKDKQKETRSKEIS